MPSLTIQLADLQGGGPLLEARVVGRAPSRDARKPVAPVTVTAMLDTGSSTTVLKDTLIEALGLEPVGRVLVSTAGHQVDCFEFAVRIVLQKGVEFNIRALALPMRGQSIECLIGRDILAKSVLIWLGLQNQFTISV